MKFAEILVKKMDFLERIVKYAQVPPILHPRRHQIVLFKHGEEPITFHILLLIAAIILENIKIKKNLFRVQLLI